MYQRKVLNAVLMATLFSLILGACGGNAPAAQTPVATPSQQAAIPTETPTLALQTTRQEMTPDSSAVSGDTDSVDVIIASLEGLPLTQFFDESSRQLLLRDPELITELGLADHLGVRNDRLNDLSEEYLQDTHKLQSAILARLQSFDREMLEGQDAISYDVYKWYLQSLVDGQAFAYHNYPVHHFLGGYQFDLEFLLTDIQPMEDMQDSEDFIARLSQVDRQVTQLIVGLEKREAIHAIPPRFILDMAIGNLEGYFSAESTSVYRAVESKLKLMSNVTPEQQQALLAEAKQAIETSYIPAFMKLKAYMEDLRNSSTDEAGVWKIDDGDAYYDFTLRKETSTNLSAAEIHDLGLGEVDRLQAEIRAAFEALGQSPQADLASAMQSAIEACGTIDATSPSGKQQVLDTYESIITGIEPQLNAVFDMRPRRDVIVVGDEGGGGGFYVNGPADSDRPGEFHAGIGSSRVPRFNMDTIAYHEAIPGHHYQIAIAQELDLPAFRTQLFFNGYVEGWALYAERLAWELGMYSNNPCGNLGRLQLELLRAVRLVTDTGIHALGWSRDEARSYMREAMGDSRGAWVHEVDRYVVWPAQATGYMIGMLKILELRERAQQTLGEDFDLKEFHNLVLGNGSLPLEVLERIVDDWIVNSQ
ncbi:MAG TPA: DUF885 domain-containing protein [Anaerolineales bacterium]|nr:DUF885 domain-containing protein [Anaerolineales bacterium]